jgi:mono/diheme cytochrome c family protein
MSEESRNQGRPAGDPGPLPPLLGAPEKQEVLDLHRAILKRERQEPVEGPEPAPWWVWAVSVLLVFAMGFYLGRYGGSFTAEPHELYRKTAPIAASEEAPPRGDLIYSAVCRACHQAGGTGLAGKYPPLAGSEWLAKDAGIAVRIVLHGLQGPIQVRGAAYVNEMPAQGPQLSDPEIAAVLTYVRSSFGNNAGPVSREFVRKIREAEPGAPLMTADKLRELAGVKK